MGEGQGTQIVLVACRTGGEDIVQAQVRARAMIAYFPRYLVNVRNMGMVARAVFPGYVFVWAYPQWWHILRTLIGVRDFVRKDAGQVETVSPDVVEAIRGREGPTGYVRIDPFFVGQDVKLKRNEDFSGVYLGLSNKHKARVLFSMLGRQVETDVFESELIAS